MKTIEEYAEELKLGCVGCINHRAFKYRGKYVDMCIDRVGDDALIESVDEPLCDYWSFEPTSKSVDIIEEFIGDGDDV